MYFYLLNLATHFWANNPIQKRGLRTVPGDRAHTWESEARKPKGGIRETDRIWRENEVCSEHLLSSDTSPGAQRLAQ